MPLTDSNTYTAIGEAEPGNGLPEERVQYLLTHKDAEVARHWCGRLHYEEGWAAIDGAVIIYNLNSPPNWLVPVLNARDDDGNTIQLG